MGYLIIHTCKITYFNGDNKKIKMIFFTANLKRNTKCLSLRVLDQSKYKRYILKQKNLTFLNINLSVHVMRFVVFKIKKTKAAVTLYLHLG